MAYASTAQLKQYLGIDEAGDDALLSSMLAAAAAAIDRFCHQPFAAESDTTRYFDAIDDICGRELVLDAPLCAITSVTNGDGVVVTSDQYVTQPRNYTPWYALMLKTNSSLTWTYTDTPQNAIAVSGRWAYSTTAPDDIVHVNIRLASYFYRQKENQSIDLDRAVAIGGNGMLLPAQLPADIKTLLTPYRRIL